MDPTLADPRLRDLDPRPGPLPDALAAARSSMTRAAAEFGSVPDTALEREWPWLGEGETDIRSAFYIALEDLEQARGTVARTLAGGGPAPGAAWGPLAATTEARWDLHGLLAPLPDAVLDADPGGEEWTVRQTLGHIVESQRAYQWFSAWWDSRRAETDLPRRAPEDLGADLPSEEDEASGSMARLRARLDALVDLGTELWRDASPDTLAVRARWSGFPVTLGFRVGRWAAHIEEHTVQVEKTLAMLDRPPTEVDRLVRVLLRGYGRLEAAAWARPADELDRTGDAGGTASDAIRRATTEVARIGAEVAALAKA